MSKDTKDVATEEPAVDPPATTPSPTSTRPLWLAILALGATLLAVIAFWLGSAVGHDNDRDRFLPGNRPGGTQMGPSMMGNQAERSMTGGTISQVDGDAVTVTITNGAQLEEGDKVFIVTARR